MMDENKKILIRPAMKVSRTDREQKQGHKGIAIWMTGLSGSGKSTLAVEIDHRLFSHNFSGIVLDGDHIRHGLSKDLGFGGADRTENLRRVAEVARLFVDQGQIVIISFISPLKSDRQQAKDILGKDFFECYISTSLSTCEARDPKGLYKMAREGRIKQFTGIDAPFEQPSSPEIVLNPETQTVSECAEILWQFILARAQLK